MKQILQMNKWVFYDSSFSLESFLCSLAFFRVNVVVAHRLKWSNDKGMRLNDTVMHESS